MKRILLCLSLTALSTIAGLMLVLVLGLISWNAARGVVGIGIGTAAAGCLAYFLDHHGYPASVLASILGAMVACFMAISTAEVLQPGSAAWFFNGGIYGLCFGVPVSLILSPLGLRR